MDKEKVIEEFEKICGYTLRPHEFQVLNDVLALLKEQDRLITEARNEGYNEAYRLYCVKVEEKESDMKKTCEKCGVTDI